MVDNINWFFNVRPDFHAWDKSHFMVVYTADLEQHKIVLHRTTYMQIFAKDIWKQIFEICDDLKKLR